MPSLQCELRGILNKIDIGPYICGTVCAVCVPNFAAIFHFYSENLCAMFETCTVLRSAIKTALSRGYRWSTIADDRTIGHNIDDHCYFLVVLSFVNNFRALFAGSNIIAAPVSLSLFFPIYFSFFSTKFLLQSTLPNFNRNHSGYRSSSSFH